MNTNTYITPEIILSTVLPKVGDREMKAYSKGVYLSLIQKAFEELAIDTFFSEKTEPFDFPVKDLTLPLPKGCFNVKNIWLFNGTDCDFSNSMKVYWKRNYYTKGNGYVANDKGNNRNDPFYDNHDLLPEGRNPSLTRVNKLSGVNNQFFYNIQGGSIMFSSACAAAANKVMINFNSTGCDVSEAPIIPVYLRTAIEEYVIVNALLMRIAEDQDPRRWQSLLQYYENRLRDPRNGSWQEAEYRVKVLNSSQREELKEYLSRGAWATGF